MCIELVSDSERMTICAWKWSICCFWLPYFEVLPHRIVRDAVLWCNERHLHAPKLEFRGSETAFKEDSWFLIAATCSETAFKEDYWFYALTASYWYWKRNDEHEFHSGSLTLSAHLFGSRSACSSTSRAFLWVHMRRWTWAWVHEWRPNHLNLCGWMWHEVNHPRVWRDGHNHDGEPSCYREMLF